MRLVAIATSAALFALGCSTPPAKENSVTNNGNAGDMSSGDVGADDGSSGGDTGSGGDDASTAGQLCESQTDCTGEEQCQSDEERSWNFCGAPMEPNCGEEEVGDSCGHCFQACTSGSECADACNGTYCIGPRTCAVPSPPPP